MTASLLTTKRIATIDSLPLDCGRRLHDVTVGYETYGCMNAARDNVVLVCHFFSGCSHAAGKYHPEEHVSGWWDAVIGPGKAIDTDRWYVVSMDVLGCIRTDAPHGVTTGPASPNPATGRPYGPDLPPLSIADSVRAQRMVLDQLGVGRLAAVAGPSLGGMQALEWAVSRPAEVDRAIVVASLAEFQAREMGLYRAMQDAIMLDPAYQGGRYDPEHPPVQGLGLAAKLMAILGSGRDALRAVPGRAWADSGRDPRHEKNGAWLVETWLDGVADAKVSTCDANAWLAMLRTNMSWDLAADHGSLEEAIARIRARVLLAPAAGDELVHGPSYHDPLVRALEQAGADYEVCPLPARNGHLAALTDIGVAADAIRTCLERPVLVAR